MLWQKFQMQQWNTTCLGKLSPVLALIKSDGVEDDSKAEGMLNLGGLDTLLLSTLKMKSSNSNMVSA